MSSAVSPARSKSFRLVTIAVSGAGSFALALWAMGLIFGNDFSRLPAHVLVATIASLCTLASAGAAVSFFAGVDESFDYVARETRFDKLTGLLSRSAMITTIADSAVKTRKSGEPVFLMDVEIGRFKQISESIGFTKADELVKAFADRLKASLPEHATIGRIGPGEFSVLYPDAYFNMSMDVIAGRLIADLMEAYNLTSHQQSVTVSVGVCAMPKDGDDPLILLRHSNLALQHARARGAGNWSVFHPDIGQVAEERQWMETELHLALERGDFGLYYQPQIDLMKRRTVGYEALIRWAHPERGIIAPADFIPIAEETGMIVAIGEWALRKACMDARYLPGDCFVAVNISAPQFMTRDFCGLVADVIRETGIRPGRLELELTESAMMSDRERAASVLRTLRDMGVSVAVDDFGTGYSNLSYLIDFPFQKLKIDRSFVSRIENDANAGAVVSTIVGLSRALGVRTVAEGVETENQAVLLRAAGCDVFQGFLFGRPMPLDVSSGVPTPAEPPPSKFDLH